MPTANPPTDTTPTPAVAYFAGGCFWGVEHMMQQVPGVLTVESGYMGGHIDKPTYEQVKAQGSGHAELVRVSYIPSEVDYEVLTKLFFEIHDPTQADGQGPDIGPQYRSEIFYVDEAQLETAKRVIDLLKAKGYDVVTRLTPASTFYLAEDYHQNYYEIKGTEPYCHSRVKRFD